nr:putative O-glycosylation ligase, exosortase A system-associated [Sphingobium boeckii]
MAFIGFLAALFGLGLKRPFLFILAYVYVDIVSPQRLSYLLLNSVPISMVAAGLAVLGWLAMDDKRNARFAPRQALMLILLLYCGATLGASPFPLEAYAKWDWVWKALAFAIFLPLTLHTRLRIEALVLYMILCAASIIIVGGLKTATAGGGYGVLNLMVSNNSGLYESSTIATVAIAIVPLILWLMKYGTIYPPDWRVRLFSGALIFACLLIPIGTEARTGLICIAVLGLLLLRFNRRRFLYIGLAGALGLIALPLLPSSFTQRMDTIQGYKADSSANTRLAVWGWTWQFAKDHPFGGGFESYRANRLRIENETRLGVGIGADVKKTVHFDAARAFHSAYFEMLGEQGYPGLMLWLAIQLGGLFRMEVIRRRYRDRDRPDELWVAPLAVGLQHAHIIYLIGALFVGIAFQPFIFMLIGVQIGLSSYLQRREKEAGFVPIFAKRKSAKQIVT